MDKAIQFLQAERLYYETALVDTTELQQKIGNLFKLLFEQYFVRRDFGELAEKKQELQPEEGSGDSPQKSHPDAIRADEFENLAKLCLENKQCVEEKL